MTDLTNPPQVTPDPNASKNFVLDTNVLLHDPNAIHKFADNTVIIPIYVIEEIDQFKKELSDRGRNARQISRFLDSYRERGNLGNGVKMDNGGCLKVAMTRAERTSVEQHEIVAGVLDRHLADNLIMAVALDVQAAEPDHPTIFITKDTNLRVRADAMGLHAENYEETSVRLDDLYPGATELEVSPELISTFYEKGELPIDVLLNQPPDPDLSASLNAEYLAQSAANPSAKNNGPIPNGKEPQKPNLFPNEYVLLRGGAQSQNALGRADLEAGVVRTLRRFKEGVWGIRPRNKEQHFALDCLMDDNIQLITLLGKAGTGKAQPLDAQVLTPSGWTPMGQLAVGQHVMTPSGTTAPIVAIFPQGELDIYRVTLSDGTSTECCLDHLWMTRTCLNRDQKKEGSVKTLREIMATLRYGARQKRNHSIPITSPIPWPQQNLPLDPYLLGCLIGDGSISIGHVGLTSKDPFIIETCGSILNQIGCYWGTQHTDTYSICCNHPAGAPPLNFIRRDPTSGKEKHYNHIRDIKKEHFCVSSVYRACQDATKTHKGYHWQSIQPTQKSVNPIKDALLKLNLWGHKSSTKFIPDIYKFADIQQRTALLQGLMDTDGTIDDSGCQTFSTVSKYLACDLRFLVQSLGGTATITTRTPSYTYKGEKKSGQLAYTCHICLPNDCIPFRLPRKVERIKARTKYHPRRYIDAVEYVGKKSAQCILIDHPDHLYLTDHCIVTHNTMLAIAAGLQKCIEEKKYHKLLVSRPIFPLGRDIGFLPGSVEEKLNPWMQPIFDNIEYLMGLSDTDRRSGRSYREFIELGMLQIEPLTYIRGRSIPQQYMIVDECLTADHLVVTADGAVRSIDQLRAPDAVLGLHIPTSTYAQAPIDATLQRTTHDLIHIFTTAAWLEATPNHPLYTFSEMSFSKKAAADLLPDDVLCSPATLPHTTTNDLSPDLAYWLALILCDGHIDKHLKTIKVACRKDTSDFAATFAAGVAAIDPTYKTKHNTNNRGDHIFSYHAKQNIQTLCDTYGFIPGNKSNTIQTPAQIWHAPLDAIKAFIRGCFDAEGDVNTHQNKSLTIHFNSTSRRFATELNLLLKKFSIQSQYAPIARVNPAHTHIHRLTLSGVEALRFVQVIGFGLPRKRAICDTFFSQRVAFPEDEARLPIADTVRRRLREHGMKTRDPLYAAIRHSKNLYRGYFNQHFRHLFSVQELAFIDNTRFEFVRRCERHTSPTPIPVFDFRVPATSTFCVNGLISSNCQNLTPHEVKTILTRAGEGTKIILTGDPYQIDNPYVDAHSNGLTYIVNRFKGQSIFATVTLTKGERSKLAELSANLL